MKVTFKSRPFAFNKKTRPILFLTASVLVFLIAIQLPFFSNIRTGIQFQLTRIGTGLGNIWDRVFENQESLRAQKDYYQNLSAQQSLDVAYVHELETRVAELEELLAYQQTTTVSSTPARIIARSPEGNYSVLIDKGSEDGIKDHMAVVMQDGHLVGTIQKAHRFTSIVKLVANAQSSIPATILSEEKTLGLIEGQDGFLLQMNYIPQSEHLNVGTVVVTSGLDGNIQEGLIIGVLHEIKKNDTDPFQQALVEPLVDVRKTSFVLVIDEPEGL